MDVDCRYTRKYLGQSLTVLSKCLVVFVRMSEIQEWSSMIGTCNWWWGAPQLLPLYKYINENWVGMSENCLSQVHISGRFPYYSPCINIWVVRPMPQREPHHTWNLLLLGKQTLRYPHSWHGHCNPRTNPSTFGAYFSCFGLLNYYMVF